MKKIANSFTLRAGIAGALCLSFIIYPASRVSSAKAAAAADVKTESQWRAEASRYDGAIRAIGGVANMQLDTPEDLKKAFAILDRERPNLKFHRSKFVVMSISDSTFSNAVKKKMPNKQATEAFLKELSADRKAVLKVEGAESLTTRIRQSAKADAATLRRAGERLKEAAEKIKKAGLNSAAPAFGVAGESKLVRAVYNMDEKPAFAPDPSTMSLIDGTLAGAVILLVAVILLNFALALEWAPYFGVGTKEDKDEVAECQQTVDGRYSTCVSEARDLPSGFPLFLREAAEAACYADWLFKQGECLTLYI